MFTHTICRITLETLISSSGSRMHAYMHDVRTNEKKKRTQIFCKHIHRRNTLWRFVRAHRTNMNSILCLTMCKSSLLVWFSLSLFLSHSLFAQANRASEGKKEQAPTFSKCKNWANQIKCSKKVFTLAFQRFFYIDSPKLCVTWDLPLVFWHIAHFERLGWWLCLKYLIRYSDPPSTSKSPSDRRAS